MTPEQILQELNLSYALFEAMVDFLDSKPDKTEYESGVYNTALRAKMRIEDIRTKIQGKESA